LQNLRLRFSSAVLAAAALALSLTITGCSTSGTSAAIPVAGASFSGQLLGGGQPISGANLQLYAPSTSGYGAASTPLFTRTITSDANGRFNFTGAYTCPSASTPVYLAINGGNPGLAAGTFNASIGMMGLLGYCGDMTPSSYFILNELTTVAAVWSLSPFMLDYAHIGTSPTNVQGLNNAFATSQALVNIANGKSPGTATSIATIPSAELNTLASILASCVNSNGSTTPSSGCGRLFSAATPAGGHAPSDTIAAALNIARYPSSNASTLFTLVPGAAPFQPVLSRAPADWTVGITYLATAFNKPTDLAIDSQGNAWVLAQGSGNAGSSTVSVLSTSGLAGTYPQSSITYNRMALDNYDGPWLTSTNFSLVRRLSSSGTSVASPFIGGGLQGPGPIMFDGFGNAWIGNNLATVTKLNASGTAISPDAGYSTGGTAGASALAIDTSGSVWVADSGNDAVEVLAANGNIIPGTPYTAAGLSGPFGIAVDSAGGAWVANRISSGLSHLTSYGAAVSGSPFSGAGLNQPIDLQIDGLGNVWLVNAGSSTVSEFLSTGYAQSGGSGYGAAALSNPFRAAIDRSGNVWVANLGTSKAGSGMITQLVGAAAPVVTPASVAIRNNALNQRP
jgi:hypothetical protein